MFCFTLFLFKLARKGHWRVPSDESQVLLSTYCSKPSTLKKKKGEQNLTLLLFFLKGSDYTNRENAATTLLNSGFVSPCIGLETVSQSGVLSVFLSNTWRVASSYSLYVGGNLCSPLCQCPSWSVDWMTQKLYTNDVYTLWERRIGNRNGKAYFLVSVLTLLIWKHVNNSSYSGAQQVQETLNTLWRLLKHVKRGKGAKESGRSFLPWVYLSHTGKSHTHRSFTELKWN